MAFDLLYQDRRDLTGPPLRDRRARLEDVVANNDLVFPVRRLAPDGLEAWRHVIERGYEGLVAKDESSVYEGWATRRWVKVKAARLDRRRGSVAAADQAPCRSCDRRLRLASRASRRLTPASPTRAGTCSSRPRCARLARELLPGRGSRTPSSTDLTAAAASWRPASNEPTVWIAYDCRASRARRVNEDDHGGRNWTGRRGRRLHMTLAGERARKHSELRMVGACLLP